jgi:hypothetical protein
MITIAFAGPSIGGGAGCWAAPVGGWGAALAAGAGFRRRGFFSSEVMMVLPSR